MTLRTWIALIVVVAGVLIMGGAGIREEPITLGRVAAIVACLALAAAIANAPKRQRRFASHARRVRPRT